VRTRVVQADPQKGPWPELAEAARIVREGGLVAFPTETVYGIALDLDDDTALRRLTRLKGRSDEKPVTIHLPDPEAVDAYVRELPRPAWKLSRRFWPGPLTLVVGDRHGRPTGFRVPDHPVCREFLRLCGCRVGGTSSNPSGGGNDARTADEVLEHFEGLLDAVIDAGPARHGRPSTVVRVVDSHVEVLRHGVIPEEEIREATSRFVLFVCTGNRCRSPLAAAFATDLLARRLGVEPPDLLEAGYRVESAGTGCLRGQFATPEAQQVARLSGIDISNHRSRPLTPTLLEEADEIFVMTGDQRRSILEFAPDAAARVKLLDLGGKDVPDPFGAGEEVYRRTGERLRRILQERLDDL
jgi:L-threonylcarbamoyladenylate synthase